MFAFEETYDSPRVDAIFECVLDEDMPDVLHIQHLHYFSANFTYQSVTSPPAIEYLRLVGTPVPEPGTGALLAIGVAVLGWSRRRSE